MGLRVMFALVVVVFTSGCASIVNGVNQPVSVVAKSPENADVVGARCTLTNSKGEWYTTTPGSVVVHRAYGNMAVNCVHPTSAGVASVKSTTKAMAFGNIIFGGLIGVGIDVGTGSAYDYPDLISVPARPSVRQVSPGRHAYRRSLGGRLRFWVVRPARFGRAWDERQRRQDVGTVNVSAIERLASALATGLKGQ